MASTDNPPLREEIAATIVGDPGEIMNLEYSSADTSIDITANSSLISESSGAQPLIKSDILDDALHQSKLSTETPDISMDSSTTEAIDTIVAAIEEEDNKDVTMTTKKEISDDERINSHKENNSLSLQSSNQENESPLLENKVDEPSPKSTATAESHQVPEKSDEKNLDDDDNIPAKSSPNPNEMQQRSSSELSEVLSFLRHKGLKRIEMDLLKELGKDNDGLDSIPSSSQDEKIDEKSTSATEILASNKNIFSMSSIEPPPKAATVSVSSTVTTATLEEEESTSSRIDLSTASRDLRRAVLIYDTLRSAVEKAFDECKYQLWTLLYPTFIFLYIKLLLQGAEPDDALKFYQLYASHQSEKHKNVILRLGTITTKSLAMKDDLVEHFLRVKYNVILSQKANDFLVRNYLVGKYSGLLTGLVPDHILITVPSDESAALMAATISKSDDKLSSIYTGFPRLSRYSQEDGKIWYGLLKEVDLPVNLSDMLEDREERDRLGGEDAADGGSLSKRQKRAKRELLRKRGKIDPNGPPLDRIPLPELRDADLIDRLSAQRDSLLQVKIGIDAKPSVCFYTVHNPPAMMQNFATSCAQCVKISDDSQMMAVGFADSSIRAFTLNPDRLLKPLLPANQLDQIDIERNTMDMRERMFDHSKGSECKTLVGHRGPIFDVSISPDKFYLISGSEDGTVRLWNTHVWANLVVYKGHCLPVFATDFAPIYGHYFVTGGLDRAARLWSISCPQAIRIFAGHLSDVSAVAFHPNVNYVATGSSDHTVKLWDVKDGRCMRTMIGHKKTIQSLTFSRNGRFLLSAGTDGLIYCWDLSLPSTNASHSLLAFRMHGHEGHVNTMAFSRDGSMLATGGTDQRLRIFDFDNAIETYKINSNNNNTLQPQQIQNDVINETVANSDNTRENNKEILDFSEMGSFATKRTHIHCVHFTRRNLILAAGPYNTRAL